VALVVADVLDDGIAAWIEQPFVAVVVPSHSIRRFAVLAVHLEDLRVPLGSPT
jgi:hypothetical protein